MKTSLKSSPLVCLVLSLCLTVSCTNYEDWPKPRALRDAPQGVLEEMLSQAKSEAENSDNQSEIPAKPPMPKGVKVAVKCGPIAAYHEMHEDFLMSRGWCGRQDADGMIQIDQEVIDLLDFTQPAPAWRRHSKDLKCFFLSLSNDESGFAYTRRDGRAKFSHDPYDNGCQPFGNDVFIDYVDGLAVYTNEDFKAVKQTHYVLADVFYRHLSKVCSVKPEKEPDGEHFEWIGGQCGYIGTDYKVVEPVIHAYENTPRPKGGIYDGDEPEGNEARLVEVLEQELPAGEKLEAVFLKSGCGFQSPYARNPAYCDEKYPGLPQELYKEGHHIREIHLRTERQNYYRGLIVSKSIKGVKGWESEVIWKSLEPIEAPDHD